MKVNFLNLNRMQNDLKEEIADALNWVINNTAYIGGEEVEKFEASFSRKIGTKYCVGVSSGLSALTLAVKAIDNIDKRKGSWIVPVNTFIATALAVTNSGNDILFVDCDISDFLIGKLPCFKYGVKGVLPVHLYGAAVDSKTIDEYRKLGLYIIEDAAQAHLVKTDNMMCGSIGDIGCFSFYPGKSIGAFGDAGAITTNNKDVYDFVKKYQNYGQKEKYNHVVKGGNERLDGIQAAILNVKLDYIERWNKRRQEIASMYREKIKTDRVMFQKTRGNSENGYHLFVIKTDKRDALSSWLNSNGIQTGLHYPKVITKQEAYKEIGGKYPIAEKLTDKIMSLPMCPYMSNGEVEYVSAKINEFFEKEQI